MNQVTEAYILGIKEGRAYRNAWPDETKSDMQRHIDNLTALIRTHSGDLKESFKGERDFWRNQLKKG